MVQRNFFTLCGERLGEREETREARTCATFNVTATVSLISHSAILHTM